MAIFFLPLVQLSLGEIPPDRYASASGLFNFIRILIGSGFGTSLSIELWTRLEIFHHARLTETLTAYQPATAQFYKELQRMDPKMTTNVVNHLLDRQVEQQAFMLSTNDIAWLGGWMFIAIIPLVFLCKKIRVRPRPAARSEAAH